LKSYLQLVRKILKNGVQKNNRTGMDALTLTGMIFEHDMEKGFPLLTTKSVPFGLVASELEFFIRGITDKKWLQDKGNHIWDEWCSPDLVPYGNDPETQKRMSEERDLGPVYGWQWRHFGGKYSSYNMDAEEQGIDQLKTLLETIKKTPDSRRMIVSAWNPVDLGHMALPPCHYSFQVTITNGHLNLLWNQRSVDVALGLPFNIASYALLLHLLCRETGYREGRLVGFLADTHIYMNHIKGLKEQLKRKPFPLPKIRTESFKDLFTWSSGNSVIDNYRHHPKIPFEVAV
jgi:thymidylate synthase